jgi:hypothetical protein
VVKSCQTMGKSFWIVVKSWRNVGKLSLNEGKLRLIVGILRAIVGKSSLNGREEVFHRGG